jgi:hypothetical protein
MRGNHFDLLKSFVRNERGNSDCGRRQPPLEPFEIWWGTSGYWLGSLLKTSPIKSMIDNGVYGDNINEPSDFIVCAVDVAGPGE